ncbi:MAG: PPC domain-containing DNA-binding protein [Thermoplasmata archaeon]
MNSNEENSLIIAKLDDGENLFNSLREIIRRHDVGSGLVLSGIGMFRNFVLGYFDGREYQRKRFKRPCELLSLQGSITTKGETVIHLHTSLADENRDVIGGHLFDAEVCSLNEIVIRKLDDLVLSRKLNPETGLKELDISARARN